MERDYAKTWFKEELETRYAPEEVKKLSKVNIKDWIDALVGLDYYASVKTIIEFRKLKRFVPDLAEFETKAKEYEKQAKQQARPAEDKGAVKEWVVNCRGVFHEKSLRYGRMPSDTEISDAYNRIYFDVERGDCKWHVVSKTFTQMCINRSKYNKGTKANTPTNTAIKRDNAFSGNVVSVTPVTDEQFFKDAAGMSPDDYDNLI